MNAGVLRTTGTGTTAANNLGLGTLTLAGGELQFGSNANRAYNRDTTVTANAILTSDRNNPNTAGLTYTLGTLTLTAANTYTGATVVSGGTLLVNGDQSAASGNVTVTSGATLGGTNGTIGGSVSAAGGTLTAGTATSIGTLNIGGNVNTAAASTWLVDLTSIANGDLLGGTNVDLLVIGGDPANLHNFTLKINDSNVQSDNLGDKYKLASFSGTWDSSTFIGGTGGIFTGQTNGSVYTVEYDGANGAFYLVSAIPEPEVWLPVLLMLALGLFLRRRRHPAWTATA